MDVSPGLISEVSESIHDEVKAWQDRPFEALYPNRLSGCPVVKMQQDGKVDNRRAKYWMTVLTNLKTGGWKTRS